MYNTPLQPLPDCFFTRSRGMVSTWAHPPAIAAGRSELGDDAVGVWKMSPGRSTFAADG